MIVKSENVAKEVISASGGVYVKRLFDMDCCNFPWIELFIKDENLRKKIEELRVEIRQFQTMPIHKDELKASFKAAIESIKNDRLKWFEAWVKKMQNREQATLSVENMLNNKYIPAIDLTEDEIEKIISNLPEDGMRKKDIAAKVKSNTDEINKIQKIIETELSPKNRWKYKDNGEPIPYPQGCQWTQYVHAWRMIAARFEGPVSAEGMAIKNEKEREAYFALGLNSVSKIFPIRKVPERY